MGVIISEHTIPIKKVIVPALIGINYCFNREEWKGNSGLMIEVLSFSPRVGCFSQYHVAEECNVTAFDIITPIYRFNYVHYIGKSLNCSYVTFLYYLPSLEGNISQ